VDGAGRAASQSGGLTLEIRRFVPADEPDALSLLHATRDVEPSIHDAAFFDWKHRQSPFGASPAWVAVADGRMVGFRTFMRWEFGRDDDVVRAVRAVDTATHPDYQGRGIFTKLTLHALGELEAEGVAFVFNTPNAKSRPGYLKMGWQLVDTLPVLARPRTPQSLVRMARARVPAEKWSLPSAAGIAAADALADHEAVAELLASTPPVPGLRTRRTPAFLSWRYSFAPLAYRALLVGDSVADGLALFRLRRRGAVLEAAMADILLPAGRGGSRSKLVRHALKLSRADVAVQIAGATDRWKRLPGVGPTLVWRAVSEQSCPPIGSWRLSLGDVEIF
jgi:GNAT superfamily N-acetyltransferase